MTDRFNTIAGWTLFSGIVALGLSVISSHYFLADKPHRPHEMGYPIAGAVEAGGAEAGPDLGTLLAAADPAKGEAIFAKCMACHSIQQGGPNGIGPDLYGVVGKPIGKHAAGFAYSDAIANHGGDWTYQNLFDWLHSPKAFAPGTKMSFAGLSSPEDRANMIAYLKANGGGPDYPAPAAPAAAAEGDAAADTGAATPAPEAAGATAAPEPAGTEAAGATAN
ncbi:MAG: cytochrome c family protein [Altererythrobacter sp.]|nr:cytochrome c family protein [Altererythrobacter sp.]OJU60758.1 MAG: cytochrome c family protein [Altererythrobacter sp. 66-12]